MGNGKEKRGHKGVVFCTVGKGQSRLWQNPLKIDVKGADHHSKMDAFILGTFLWTMDMTLVSFTHPRVIPNLRDLFEHKSRC